MFPPAQKIIAGVYDIGTDDLQADFIQSLINYAIHISHTS